MSLEGLTIEYRHMELESELQLKIELQLKNRQSGVVNWTWKKWLT